MKRRRFNAVWLLVGFIVLMCAGLYWLTNRETMKTLQQKYPNVKVYYEDDEPSQQDNSQNTADAGTNSPPATPTNNETVISASPSESIAIGENSRVLFCSICDPLGEPVERGTIRLGESTHLFQLGAVRIKLDTPIAESAEIVAEADGYQSATRTVNPKETLQIDITLDYLCNFDVRVYQPVDAYFWNESEWKPQAGADVVLYRSALCKRPLQPTQRALLEYEFLFGDPLKYDFKYEDGEIRIERINALSAYYNKIESPNLIQPYSFLNPKAGDLLELVGWNNPAIKYKNIDVERLPNNIHRAVFYYEIPLFNALSNNARMMDSLQLSLKSDSVQKSQTSTRFIRDSRICNKTLFFPAYRGAEEIVAKTKSGPDGKCRFEKLPPGLYFVRAQYANQRSMVRPLFPSSGGVKLILNSESRLELHTRRIGVPEDCYLNAERVPNVQVTLRPKDATATGVYTTETDQYGEAKLGPLPFGTYTLTARPPEKERLAPIQEEMIIDVPLKDHTIQFKDWDRHDIEGTAVLHDTKAPIPDLSIELYEHRSGTFYPSAVTKTDDDGAFAFRGLPQGNYQIRYIPDSQNEHKYYSFEPSQRVPEDHAPFYIPSHDDRTKTVFVRDDPVYTVELLMVETVATRFSGKVIDSDKSPVPKAAIKLFRHAPFESMLEIYPPHLQFESDKEGNFDITIWTRDLAEWRDTVYSGLLTAKIFAEIPPQAISESPVDSFRIRVMDLSQHPALKSGSLEFPFKLGEHKKDLEIVAGGEQMISLEGRIRTEDGLIPNDARIILHYTTGGIEGIMGEYKSNGEFVVSGVENKGFYLQVQYAYCNDENSPTGLRELLDENVLFEPSQINEMFDSARRGEPMKLEITMKDACWLDGVLLDADKKPLPNVIVRTDPNLGVARWARTDKEGKFHISQLEKDKTYSLYASSDITDAPDFVLSDVPSNTKDIILIWENAPKE